MQYNDKHRYDETDYDKELTRMWTDRAEDEWSCWWCGARKGTNTATQAHAMVGTIPITMLMNVVAPWTRKRETLVVVAAAAAAVVV